MTKVATVVAVVGCLVASAGTAEAGRGSRLQTHAGVLTLGGSFTFSIDHVNPDGNADSRTGVLLTFAPSFGGFVVRNLLLSGTLAIQTGFGDLYDNALPYSGGVETTIGFGFELQYLFNYGSRVVPYLGFALGPAFAVPGGPGDTAVAMGFAFPGGILIALNEHVAVNVGIRLALEVGVTEVKGTILRVPIGYLGVNAYF